MQTETAVEAESGPTVSAFMLADQREVVELLDRAEFHARCHGVSSAAEPFTEFRRRAHRHLDMEEEVVHPMLHHLGAPPVPSEVITRRAAIRRMLHEGTKAVHQLEAGGLVRALSDLREAMAEHHAFEREQTYPLIDRLLASGPRRGEVVRELDSRP